LNFINIKLILNFTKIKMPAYKISFAKVTVQFSASTFGLKIATFTKSEPNKPNNFNLYYIPKSIKK